MSRNSRGVVAVVMAIIFCFGPEIIGLKAGLVRAETLVGGGGIDSKIISAILEFKDRFEMHEDEDGAQTLADVHVADVAGEFDSETQGTWQVTKLLDDRGVEFGQAYVRVNKDASVFVDLTVTLDGKDASFRGNLLSSLPGGNKIVFDGTMLLDGVASESEYSVGSNGALYATDSGGGEMCAEGCGEGIPATIGSGVLTGVSIALIIVAVVVGIVCGISWWAGLGWCDGRLRRGRVNLIVGGRTPWLV